MKAYMGHNGEPEDGACLVFAHSAQEARVLTWRVINDWYRSGLTELQEYYSLHHVISRILSYIELR